MTVEEQISNYYGNESDFDENSDDINNIHSCWPTKFDQKDNLIRNPNEEVKELE